ncbi:MAG: penicillin amidase, partial [Lentimicrobiaceae bacterium]|nr:penicillin amidase [Lentimicrobiaceae bacterium]
MTKRFQLIIIISALLLPFNSSRACTEILVKAKDSSVVTVRSMEFGVELNSELKIQPRGEIFTSITPDSTPGMQ